MVLLVFVGVDQVVFDLLTKQGFLNQFVAVIVIVNIRDITKVHFQFANKIRVQYTKMPFTAASRRIIFLLAQCTDRLPYASFYLFIDMEIVNCPSNTVVEINPNLGKVLYMMSILY